MHRQAPTKQEAEALGLTLEEATRVTEVWPDNMESIRVFSDLATQWQMGYSGPIGLRYESLPVVLQMRGIPVEQHEHLFTDLRVLEDEALRIARVKAQRNG